MSTHSCCSLYLRSVGNSTGLSRNGGGGTLLEGFADRFDPLGGELPRGGRGASFRPHVGERVLGVGEDQRPPVGSDDLDPVEELEVAGWWVLDELAHDRPFAFPRGGDGVVDLVDRGEVPYHPGEGSPGLGEQVEEVGEGGHGVIGGEERGPDERPAGGGGEGDPTLGG